MVHQVARLDREEELYMLQSLLYLLLVPSEYIPKPELAWYGYSDNNKLYIRRENSLTKTTLSLYSIYAIYLSSGTVWINKNLL